MVFGCLGKGREGKDWIWAITKYKKIGDFCFRCRIGHVQISWGPFFSSNLLKKLKMERNLN